MAASLQQNIHGSADAHHKFIKLDQVNQHGMSVSVGAEDWVQQQRTSSNLMDAHTDSIKQLTKGLETVQGQVKAMARVMATQNVQKLNENLKIAVDDLRKFMLDEIDSAKEYMESQMSKEVGDLNNKRFALNKKVDEMAEGLLEIVTNRVDDINKKSLELEENVEKTLTRFGDAPSIVKAEVSAARDVLEGKIGEIKKQLVHTESNARAVQVTLDKALLNMHSELKAKNEQIMASFAIEQKQFARSWESQEASITDKLKLLKTDLASEASNRDAACKDMSHQMDQFNDEVRAETRRFFAEQDQAADRKIDKVKTAVAEVKKSVETERTNRESSVQDLTRTISQEKRDREMDEDKLLHMISSCMHTIDKMHQQF